MPNDLMKLKRLMRAANHVKKNNPVVLRGLPINPSQALKYAWWFEGFHNDLRIGVWRFSYFKKDGSIREARGTLNPLLIPENKMPRNGFETDNGTPAGTFAYYDIDAGDWRSFCLENFIGFVSPAS